MRAENMSIISLFRELPIDLRYMVLSYSRKALFMLSKGELV
ncbi:MAG: hypothetical protein Hyperionvirus28_1, partial [Hyperionvirus sp.]